MVKVGLHVPYGPYQPADASVVTDFSEVTLAPQKGHNLSPCNALWAIKPANVGIVIDVSVLAPALLRGYNCPLCNT
jgi:hypothetical protein